MLKTILSRCPIKVWVIFLIGYVFWLQWVMYGGDFGGAILCDGVHAGDFVGVARSFSRVSGVIK